MASIFKAVRYIPIDLIADTLATFLSGYRPNQWSTTAATVPGDAAVVNVREGVMSEITLTTYLDQAALTDLDPWHANSTVTPTLEYFDDGTDTWISTNPIEFDSDDFETSDPAVAASDFTVQVKGTGADRNTIQIQIPRKIAAPIRGKYRLKVEIDQRDA